MRVSVALVVTLVMCGCAETQRVDEPPVSRAEVRGPSALWIDVDELFPSATSRTMGDARALAPSLLSRVALERNALTGVDGVDPWLSRALIGWLVERGAAVTSAPTGATASLVGVRFAQAKQDVAIAVVDNEDGSVLVRYWAGKKDISMCQPAMRVPITYVQLEAVLVDANQRVVASIAELTAATPASMRVEVTVDADPCAAIAAAFADELQPSEDELVKAANAALEAGFSALVTPSP